MFKIMVKNYVSMRFIFEEDLYVLKFFMENYIFYVKIEKII